MDLLCRDKYIPNPFRPSNTETDTLVVYVSSVTLQPKGTSMSGGNTAVVAQMIEEKTKVDIFEIISDDGHYPSDFDLLQKVAKFELSQNSRPKYVGNVPNLSKYKNIFVGGPAWYMHFPMPMYTFLEENDLSGKTIIPFDTYVVSGLSGIDSTIKKSCPKSKVISGIAIIGEDAKKNPKGVREQLNSFLLKLGFK